MKRPKKKHNPKVTIRLDKRKKLIDGSYNAVLSVNMPTTTPASETIYQHKFYPIYKQGERLRFKVNNRRNIPKMLLEDATADAAKKRAQAIIEQLPEFTYEAFEREYYRDVEPDSDHLVGALLAYADSLSPVRLKTAKGYRTVATVVNQYTKNKPVGWHEITPGWLQDFENWMQTPTDTHRGRTDSTVGIYMRNIRAVVRPKLTGTAYPFGKAKERKYEIPASRNIKKALTLADVGKVFHYPAPNGSMMQYCRDLWLLSYLCNGANIKDLARLRFCDINSDNITFLRSKTLSTKRSAQRKIIVPLTAEIARLIDRWKVPGGPDEFVLPIIAKDMNAQKELGAVETTVKAINKTVRAIAAEVGIQMDITTYTARHSFATVLMHSGATVAMISKALGHASVTTTEAYLGDFDDKTRREFAAMLTKFPNMPDK